MKLFKKLSLLIILFIISLFFVSCKDNNNNEQNDFIETLTIYTVNDFHGSLEEEDGKKGASRMAEYILSSMKGKEESSIILSAGDMFQGSAISNYTYGQPVIDVMNHVGFNAMALGNHEFDWGLETIQRFVDKDMENGEANFDFLGCNIQKKSTGTLPAYIKPYTIIERKNLKIGVIGYIGFGQEKDILSEMVEDYTFLEPVEVVKDYSYILRHNEGCNVIVALGHDASSSTNMQLSKLSDDYRIDAIINGHSHSVYNDTYRRSDKVVIPCLQAGSAGSHVGVVNITIDKETNQVIGGSSFTKEMNNKINKNLDVEKIVNQVVLDTAHIFERVLCQTDKEITRIPTANFIANMLADKTDSKVGFINIGGVRANAFPIEKNQNVNVKKIYQILPFDNTIVTLKLKGSLLIKMLDNSDLVYSKNTVKGSTSTGYLIDGVAIDDEKEYQVATINFCYENNNYNFYLGTQYQDSKKVLRDLMIETLEEINSNGSKWNGDYQ